MKCRQFRQFMDDYLDGELGMELLESFKSHERGCQECRAKLHARRSLFRMMSIAAEESVAVDLVADVMALIQKAPAPAAPSPYRWPTVIAIASALTVGILIFMLGIGSVLGGISPLEAVLVMFNLVEVPSDLQYSLDQAKAFITGIATGARAIVEFAVHILKLMLLTFPYIVIPTLILGLMAGAALWFIRHRTRKGLVRQ